MSWLRITLVLVGFALLFTVGSWFNRAFQHDRDLGMSRLLAGWNDARFNTFHKLYFAIEVGTPVAELDDVLKDVYPAGGKRLPPNRHDDDEKLQSFPSFQDSCS